MRDLRERTHDHAGRQGLSVTGCADGKLRFQAKQARISAEIERCRSPRIKPTESVNQILLSAGSSPLQSGITLAELLKRPELNYEILADVDTDRPDLAWSERFAVEVQLKYEGYIRKQERFRKRPLELWIRTAVIPDATDRAENIGGIGRFIATHLNGWTRRWELCAFNHLCRDKYLRLGLDWPFKNSPLLLRTVMDHLGETARTSGVDPAIVHCTGETRPSDGESASFSGI